MTSHAFMHRKIGRNHEAIDFQVTIQYRGEVWRHITMVALFLDDNRTNDDGDGDGKENGEK